MDKIKIGIIGLGNMGSTHYKKIMAGECPHISVAAVADISPVRRDAVASLTPEDFTGRVEIFESGEALIESGVCDSVLIAVPHYDHPALAEKAFAKGLHVMCEKPAGVYTKQVKRMNEASQNAPVVFGMMFNQRTNCIYRKMRELVHSGKYGEIRRVSWLITNWYRSQFYYDSGDWRATWAGEGGGVLLNQCPHNLDLLQWICGMPTAVQANMHFGKWHDIEVEDDVTAYMEFENGATGTFITSTGDPCGTNRFEIQMDGAKIISENGKLSLFELEMSEQQFSKQNTQPFGAPAFTVTEVETDGLNEQHIGVLNAFAHAILHGGSLIADGREGINALTLSNAMHLSAFKGKKVYIPFDENEYFTLLNQRIKTSKTKEKRESVVAATDGSYNNGR